MFFRVLGVELDPFGVVGNLSALWTDRQQHGKRCPEGCALWCGVQRAKPFGGWDQKGGQSPFFRMLALADMRGAEELWQEAVFWRYSTFCEVRCKNAISCYRIHFLHSTLGNLYGICKMLYIAFCKVRTDVPLYKQKYPIYKSTPVIKKMKKKGKNENGISSEIWK